MRNRGPILTLGIIGVLIIGILTANALVGSDKDSNKTGATSSKATVAATTTTTAAPVESGFPAQVDYSGYAGDSIALNITVTGTKATAYACDGNSVESWLRGPAENGKLNLTSKSGDKLTGQLNGTTVTGTLTIGGRSWDFSANQTEPPAGMYRYNDNGYRYSWVYRNSTDNTGVVRAPDGSTSPAPPLDENQNFYIEGRQVHAEKVNGDDAG
ncbi:hypothetical protein [Smaragdicoccus niigatensis]|uniref:hypothetical protein n=1 Tax=Smaragdicoccus niigatensis TaxID=359359 RepID=UPI00037358DB|nr:hypothetical protein [Smaragdicoccus niigatensis]